MFYQLYILYSVDWQGMLRIMNYTEGTDRNKGLRYFPWHSPGLILGLHNDVTSTAEVTESHSSREKGTIGDYTVRICPAGFRTEHVSYVNVTPSWCALKMPSQFLG
jgi:hypothetical protein